jgi:zinc protease
LALSAGTAYSPGAVDLSTFRISAVPKPGVTVEDLEAAVEGELDRLTRDGVDPDEVRRATERMQAASVYAQDSLMGPAEIIGAGLATGQSLDAVEDWPRRIGAVTATAVDAAAHALFLPRNSATGVLLPERGS